jgi:hypothetical protein
VQEAFNRNKLHPWPVIQSFLSDLNSSDELVRLISRAGIEIEIQLEHPANHSHKTRIRAYLPRIQKAIGAFDEDEKLRITAVIAHELVKKEELADHLRSALERIGWTIKDGILTTSNGNVIDVFFPKGAVHDAYVGIREILVSAKLYLDIIDPYSDSTIFQMISTSSTPNLRVQILTAKTSFDLATEAKKFKQQNARFNISIRTTDDFHDRFIVCDSKDCFHLGHSIKDFGSKACMLTQIQDKPNCDALRNQFENSWQSAIPFNF